MLSQGHTVGILIRSQIGFYGDDTRGQLVELHEQTTGHEDKINQKQKPLFCVCYKLLMSEAHNIRVRLIYQTTQNTSD